MEFESSLSSLIGKIYEDFDYFCSEAKLILPQKQVENVQEQLIAAGEGLKQIFLDIEDKDDISDIQFSDETQFSFSEQFEQLHAQLMASLFQDDEDYSSSISYFKSIGDDTLAEVSSYGAVASDSQSEFHDSDCSHLLGQDFRAELIKLGFLSPRLGSVQSTMSDSSEETEEGDSWSDDTATSSADSFSSRTSSSIPNMRDYKINSKANRENVGVAEDDGWEKLDEDFIDEDWEIV